jgi:hypothetical protein
MVNTVSRCVVGIQIIVTKLRNFEGFSVMHVIAHSEM